LDKFNKNIYSFITRWSLLTPGDRVLVACSGGVDSVTLLHFLAMNRDKLGIEVAAIHVDHMLRGQESAEDGVFVRELCTAFGIPFFGKSIPVLDILNEKGGNVQSVCRQERYAFFTKVMRKYGYAVLATAHHAGDQLETVLIQTTKGSMPSGIPIKREIDGGHLIRPFLPTMKATLYTYAAENSLQFREDPSNESDAYLRNRFRHHVVPIILSENPTAAEKVVEMTSRLQEDEKLLETLAKTQLDEIIEFTEEGLPCIEGLRFSGMPVALQRRMIPLLLNYLYHEKNVSVEYKSGLIGQILQHFSTQKGNVSIDLPFGYRLLREYGKLKFVRSAPQPEIEGLKILPKGVWTYWENGVRLYWAHANDLDMEILTNADEKMYFDLPDESLPLYVRRRKDGDRLLLPGMAHSKRLSRLFIDEKIGMSDRDRLPVVVTAEDEICAVPGLRYGIAFTKDETVAGKYIFVLEKK
jgi:tRNA(Ile)-lysidine synthetase-like protein